jgi:hypothetical protein
MKPHSWLTTRIVTRIEAITPSCKDMTHLLSQSMDCRLALRKRLGIWIKERMRRWLDAERH